MGDLRSAFSINSCRFWIQKTMMIFLKGKQRESLPRNVAYMILTSFKSATFASTSRDWLKPQPQQQHQQQEQGAKQTKTEDCEFSIVNGTTRFLVLGTPCNWSNTRIFVWPAISIQQGMMIYPTLAMQTYTLARNSYLLHLY